eukprot:c19290_g1_i1 orf=667-1047(-)
MAAWTPSTEAAPRTKRQAAPGEGLPSLATWTHLDRRISDKENVDPPSADSRSLSSIPWRHPRYPLQDITLLMHLLQGMQLDESNLVTTSSSRSNVVVEARNGRSARHVPRSNSNHKSSSMLQMSYR